MLLGLLFSVAVGEVILILGLAALRRKFVYLLRLNWNGIQPGQPRHIEVYIGQSNLRIWHTRRIFAIVYFQIESKT